MSSGGAGKGAPAVPAAARKVVMSLKEIVNCPEHEIYAMLKECNMDPNETVSRLLSQDTFHEVKSKKEKKKENKDSSDTKSRGSNSFSSRGFKNVADRSVGRSASNQISSNSDVGRAKPTIKKEIGGTVPSTLTSSIPNRDVTPTDGSGVPAGINSSISTPSLLSGYQSTWAGLPPGQLSMADIVKRGRPQSRPPTLPNSNPMHQNVMQPPAFPSLPVKSHHNQAVPQASISDELGSSKASAVVDYGSSISMHEKTSIRLTSGSDEMLIPDEDKAAKHPVPFNLENQPEEDNLNDFDDNSYDNGHDYLEKSFEHSEAIGGNSHLHASEYPESSQVEDVSVEVSVAAADLQELSLQKEELGQPSAPAHAEDNPAVVMPNHFQDSSADCAHLSFGSFGSGMSAASFSGPSANKNLKHDYVDSVLAVNASQIERSDVRKSEYYGNDNFTTPVSNENVDVPSSSQPEIVADGSAAEALQGQPYTFPTASSYGFEDAVQPNAPGASAVQTNPHMHNLAHLSSILQPYPISLPNALLASAVHPGRELDVPYSPFAITQSMATKVPPITGSTLSIPEGAKANVLPVHQLTAQTLPNSNIAQGSIVPQHIPVHPYSPPNLPLSHFTNMISYPFLPQSYPYLPYAAGSSAFHQSPAAVASAAGLKYPVPQFKSSISGNSLPQAGSIASGYGGSFGIATSVSNFNNLNASNSVSTTLGYDDMLSSQFKEGNHYVSLQQNEGSNTWIHGPDSRTMPTFPPSTYYSFQNQNQPTGFRQGQQPSPYGNLGYPNFYHSQPGVVTQEHQPPSDGTVGTSQGPTSQQSHQIWQHSY